MKKFRLYAARQQVELRGKRLLPSMAGRKNSLLSAASRQRKARTEA
jgi:hypothetical protein